MRFSGLNQALLPVLGEFSELTATHRDALNVALGLGEGEPPDRLVVSNATVALLRGASIDRPLLLIVDDLPWLDRSSAGVLGYAARRVAGSRIGFLAASRTEEESFFDRVVLPELELRPLDAQAAGSLVDARFPTLAPNVRDRMLAEAQGNPLALLELPAVLSDAQRTALEALPVALPPGRRLQALFASRVRELPAPSRQLLLLMALDGTGELRLLNTTAAGSSRLEHLGAAEKSRLAYVDEATRRPSATRRSGRRWSSSRPAKSVGKRTESSPGCGRIMPTGAPGIWRMPRSDPMSRSPSPWSRRRTRSCGEATGWAPSPRSREPQSSARGGVTEAGGLPRPPTSALTWPDSSAMRRGCLLTPTGPTRSSRSRCSRR